jgi:hypothetical protein
LHCQKELQVKVVAGDGVLALSVASGPGIAGGALVIRIKNLINFCKSF